MRYDSRAYRRPTRITLRETCWAARGSAYPRERRPAKFGEREAILNKFGQGEFHAYSAVSQPKGQVNRTQSSCCRGSATRP